MPEYLTMTLPLLRRLYDEVGPALQQMAFDTRTPLRDRITVLQRLCQRGRDLEAAIQEVEALCASLSDVGSCAVSLDAANDVPDRDDYPEPDPEKSL